MRIIQTKNVPAHALRYTLNPSTYLWLWWEGNTQFMHFYNDTVGPMKVGHSQAVERFEEIKRLNPTPDGTAAELILKAIVNSRAEIDES